MANPHIGSSFDDFLVEEGIYEEVQVAAVKRVLAWKISQIMAEQQISQSTLAKRMQTSRTQVKRLLDPTNDQVQLDTLQRAATALNRNLIIDLV